MSALSCGYSSSESTRGVTTAGLTLNRLRAIHSSPKESPLLTSFFSLSFFLSLSSFTQHPSPELSYFIMARRPSSAFICLLIVMLDILAGVLGIEAQAAQNKVKHASVWIFECRDPSRDAFKLGLTAAILLGLAHVIANFLGGFVCICSKDELDRSSANKQLAAASLVLSWIILAIGFSMLTIGASVNSKSKGSCGISRNRCLLTGGILCFFHALFCVSYYVSANATIEEVEKSNQRGSGGAQMA
ncbi:hypothetical protein GIB67_039903 [Kingdonia uniflora]|uniref:Uncharacterized protein n=1 Tax=Kingdonia uniflora TaxID=39325 RepID=A0A7J7P3W9_9MAGN|nr:hypothetical protein GIB67_039903 [Kingdonia uniflora]